MQLQLRQHRQSHKSPRHTRVACNYVYRPYGALLQSEESIPNLIQYSSEIYDSELGLFYYNYRHNNPKDGRGLICDPIQEDGSLNLYEFVGNNPLLWFDYLGRNVDIQQGLSVQKEYMDAGVVAGDLTPILLAPRPLLEGEVSVIYVSDQPGLDVPELCGDLVHVNEDTSTPSDFQPNQLLGEKACIKELIILMHGEMYETDPRDIKAEVEWGDTALNEGRTVTEISDMFKNIRFCKPCTLELRSCDIGREEFLKKRLEKNTVCRVSLYNQGVGLFGKE